MTQQKTVSEDKKNEEKKDESSMFDLGSLASTLQKELKVGRNNQMESSISEEEFEERYFKTLIPGFDKLLKHGIPKKSNILLAGSTGAGKTIFALQLLMNHAKQGKKCLFISFEESKQKLIRHMKDFGWDPESVIESGNLKIKRYLTSDIYYKEERGSDGVQAMMAKNSDHLMLDLEPFIIGEDGYKPDITVIDSLTAVASTFEGKEKSYRFYLERLFRFFEQLGGTTFLITEPIDSPISAYYTGTEKYLSDGIIEFYNAKRRNIRESAIEVLKMRGEKHEKKIVAMNIGDEGIVVHPNQEVFSEIES